MSGRPILRPVDAAVAAVLAGILYASLARHGRLDCSRWAASLLRESWGVPASDLLGNVFAYWLLGLALAFAISARRPALLRARAPALGGALAVTAACALLSLSMEAAQACLSGRVSSAWDLLANAVGGALGWLTARAVAPAWSSMAVAGSAGAGRRRVLAAVTLAALAWLTAETAPWLPVLDADIVLRRLAAAWRALDRGVLDPWRLALRAGEWLALGAVLALALRRSVPAAAGLAGLAATALAWQLVLPAGRGPSPETLVTLFPVLLATAVLARTGPRPAALAALAGTALAMLAFQLEPGYGPARPFAWRVLLLHGDAVRGIEYACWFAWPGIVTVVAGRGVGGRPIGWVLVAPALLAATAWLQASIPGRGGDLSPPLAALAAGALAAVLLAGVPRTGRTGRTVRAGRAARA